MGSEMCIRDRRCCPQNRSAPVGRRSWETRLCCNRRRDWNRTAVTTHSAAPTSSEGSEGAFSSARVLYSLPSDRRQTAAMKGLICHFHCPAQACSQSMLFRMHRWRNNPGTGTIWMVAIWMAQEAAPTAIWTPCRNATREPPACFGQSLWDFSNGFPPWAAHGLGLGSRKPPFTTQGLRI